MAKLVFSVLMIVVWWTLHALQMDEEVAMGTVHEAKRAIDRAAHAAAQQLDRNKLEMGVLSLQPESARGAAWDYLRGNLALDAELNPLPGSFLREAADVRAFVVVNEDEVFPYTYRNSQYGYEVTLARPGVVLIVHLEYPRLFGVLAPVEWDLKGSAELVY
ncbi:hypothetical protein D7Z26_24970 [Cohnella endophytica]|uniref:Uncharacterized protein n=1 Tax=Cohnella endophytica TaxID=2419778 RepID=A0A494XBE8_9BACL|nr:hypothetical protein [Cohnella endophytica]RKP45806.1 hypothetical protein D7Z26_24970 [Cohnella endophytica]